MRLWLFRKFIFQKKIFQEPTTLFSLMGIALGVAFLVVLMAGFSGFTESLKNSIIDVTGDINVFRRGAFINDPEAIRQKITESSPYVKNVMGYVQKEVLVANKGKLLAVTLQGVHWGQTLRDEQMVRRQVAVVTQDQQGLGRPAMLGKVVAKNLNLSVGQSFKAILLQVPKTTATRFSRKAEKFYVHSILDFGKYDFNERIVITDTAVVQTLGNMKNKINGFRIQLKDSDLAPQVAEQIQQNLGWEYSVRDWSLVNKSMFRAIRYEKQVLFFVMLIMVVAAFFNVSTTLFLGVLRRYSQISVMRALGLKKSDVVSLFCLHGLGLGTIGLLLGLILGHLFCLGFENVQKVYPIMPEEVYRMSNFATHMEWRDVMWVSVATLVICFISTLAPAFRGAKLSPVEGLKYE